MENENQKMVQTGDENPVNRTSKVNGLDSIEDRLKWCEEYIKILLSHKDESIAMHILDGKDISEMNRKIVKLEETN